MRKHKGFTLLELTTSIIIVSILAASASFCLKGTLSSARKALIQDTAHTFRQDLSLIELLTDKAATQSPHQPFSFANQELQLTGKEPRASITNIRNLLGLSTQDWDIESKDDETVQLVPKGTKHPQSCYIRYTESSSPDSAARIELPTPIFC